MLETFPEVVAPDWGFSDETSEALHEVQFGDGYRLTVPAGINYQRGSWSLTWELDEAGVQLLYPWLKARKSVTPFLWTHPDGEVYQVLCKSLRKSWRGFNDYTVSATFVQDFNPV